jgi:hypothetical protein
MNIYLVKRSEHTWDEYDAFVVAAHFEADAMQFIRDKYDESYWPNVGTVTAELVGTTDKYDKPTEILGSFNAG